MMSCDSWPSSRGSIFCMSDWLDSFKEDVVDLVISPATGGSTRPEPMFDSRS